MGLLDALGGAALKLLAEHLPTTVDQASPNGMLEPNS